VPRSPAEDDALGRQLRADGFAILHANTRELGRLTGRIAGAAGAAGVCHVRSFGTVRPRERALLGANAALVAVSTAVERDLIRQGLPPDRIHVVHNGVAECAPRPAVDIRAELALPAGTPLIVWAGQLTVRKGPLVFLDVARGVAARCPDAHFVLLGDVFGSKAENAALKDRAIEAAGAPPLAGRLHLMGWRRDAVALLGQSTLLVHTALQEPFGRVLLEALAAGCPIVGTNVGGTAELLGPCGLLAPAGAVAALRDAALALLADPARRRALADAGRARWRAFFRPDRTARAVERIWSAAAGGRPDRSRSIAPSPPTG
jgi:glycosyltransferase involved in cell wall biosynthesis